ncbi:sensor histidine kinase [Candidatus Parcubacteria bacterium]|nr:MAG: sensor histidine kinase [Candidatus Parcubacteria bacterium]
MLNEALARLEQGEVGARSGKPLQTVETIIQAQEEERRRLSRQMHDGPAQALSNFILQTEIALRLFDRDPEQAREELQNLKHAAAKTFQQVRDFIFTLRPMMLDDLGLVPTVKRYLDTLEEQTGVDIQVHVAGGERRLAPYLEVFIFRAIQELVGNALAKGQATRVQVQLDMEDKDQIKVQVEDNGMGFDPESLKESEGMGLRLLRERVEMLDGTLEIHSTPGQGTRVTFEVPAASPSALG